MKEIILINTEIVEKLNTQLPIGQQLNIIDAAILTWLMDFQSDPDVQKIVINQEVYFLVTYDSIINDLPLLGITNKQVMKRRIDKLINVGLIGKYIDVSNGSLTYFTVK